MKKKKSYFIWLASIIIFSALLILFTFLFYLKKLDLPVYLSLELADLTLIATFLPFHSKFILPYINDYSQERDLNLFVDRVSESRTVIESINNGKKIIYISGRQGIGKKIFLMQTG